VSARGESLAEMPTVRGRAGEREREREERGDEEMSVCTDDKKSASGVDGEDGAVVAHVSLWNWISLSACSCLGAVDNKIFGNGIERMRSAILKRSWRMIRGGER